MFFLKTLTKTSISVAEAREATMGVFDWTFLDSRFSALNNFSIEKVLHAITRETMAVFVLYDSLRTIFLFC